MVLMVDFMWGNGMEKRCFLMERKRRMNVEVSVGWTLFGHILVMLLTNVLIYISCKRAHFVY